MIKNFLGDAKIYIVVRGFVALSWLLTLKVYTHFLSPTEYGLYSVLFFLTTIFSTFSISWISASYIRYFPDWGNDDNVIESIYVISIITITISSIFLFCCLFLCMSKGMLEVRLSLIIICCLHYIFLSSFTLMIGKLSAERKLKKLSFFTIGQFIFGLFFTLMFLYLTKLGIYGIFIGLLLSNLFFLVLLIYSENLPRFKIYNFNKNILKVIINYGSPIFLINILSNLLTSADLLLLKYYNLDIDAGIYSANYSLADKSINVLINTFTVAYLPTLFGIWSTKGSKEAYVFYRKVIYLYICISIPMLIVLLKYNSYLFSFLLPEKYDTNNIIIFIMLGSYFWSIGQIFSDILTLNKKTLKLAFCYLLPAILNILANFLFIPKFGMKACAIISMISYIILTLTIIVTSYKTIISSNEIYK